MRTLATLAQVKRWLGIEPSNTAADPLLEQLLKGATTFVYKYLDRDSFSRRTYNETYDGYGKDWMTLRNTPVLSVEAVSANGIPYQPAVGDGISTPYTGGYTYLNNRLTLFGQVFPRQRSSVFVRYDSGFALLEEAHTIPASGSLEVETDRHCLEPEAVRLADGSALVQVDGTPGAGQYQFDGTKFIFNSAQAGLAIKIDYSYVPEDIVEAVFEMVGERYKYKDRIGYSSKSLGGQETVSFSSNNVPTWIKEMLNPYKRVTPTC